MTELLEKAIAAFNVLPPDQQRQLLEQTRKSFAENNVALSRPAAPVNGLTVAFYQVFLQGDWLDCPLSAYSIYTANGELTRKLCDYSQAESIIEAELQAQQRLLDIIEEANTDKEALQAENAALTAKLAKTETHVEAVKNTLSVRCTDVAFLEERCKMLENEMSAPKGYRVIPKHPTEAMLWTMAFNLSSEFGSSFTLENKPFALAVYKQAWEMGLRLETKASPSAQAEAIIAAERAENEALKAGIKRLSDEQELLSETTGCDLISVVRLAARVSEAEVDNAALTARVKELEAENAALEKQALRDRSLANETHSDATLWQFSVDMGDHPSLLVKVWRQRKAFETQLAATRKALEEIASFTQTTDLLWWQERARAALETKQ